MSYANLETRPRVLLYGRATYDASTPVDDFTIVVPHNLGFVPKTEVYLSRGDDGYQDRLPFSYLLLSFTPDAMPLDALFTYKIDTVNLTIIADGATGTNAFVEVYEFIYCLYQSKLIL